MSGLGIIPELEADCTPRFGAGESVVGWVDLNAQTVAIGESFEAIFGDLDALVETPFARLRTRDGSPMPRAPHPGDIVRVAEDA